MTSINAVSGVQVSIIDPVVIPCISADRVLSHLSLLIRMRCFIPHFRAILFPISSSAIVLPFITLSSNCLCPVRTASLPRRFSTSRCPLEPIRLLDHRRRPRSTL